MVNLKTWKQVFPLLVLLPALHGQALDPRFHSYPEIQSMLYSLAAVPAFEDIYIVDTIGYSQHDQLPILAVKISDNVGLKEDEPRVLFLGQVHAEEVLGVEAVLKLILLMLDPPPSQALHMNILRNELETWIVPSYNPEGMSVVYSGLDVSYRKNKHDFSPDGPWPNNIFDYDPSIGNDIDGVDMNRNYDFNWIFGEGFLELDPSPYGAHYDYFKGLVPFSEPETRAIRDLARENDFLFSITWHSSRSGNLSEKVFYPWSWDGKVTPDDAVITTIGETLAGLLVNESGEGTYLDAYGGSRNGKAHDWFYAATGCIQYLVECGTSNLHPDSLIIEDTIDRLLPGMLYLMDRSIGYYTDATQITGTVLDGGAPLENANVKLIELSSSVQELRLTDEFGRFRRIVEPGTYSLVFSKPGYYSDTVMATANSSTITSQTVSLLPKLDHDLVLNITGSPAPINQSITGIFTADGSTDTINLTEGSNTISLTAGEWQVVIQAAGYQAWIGSLISYTGADYSILLAVPDHLWVADLSDSNSWDFRQGPWDFSSDTLKSQADLLYPNSTSARDTFKLLSRPINVSGSNQIVASLTHRYETEWEQDSISLMVVDVNDSLLAYWSVADQHWSDTITTWISSKVGDELDSIRVALLFNVDGSVNYRGWQILGIELSAATMTDMAVQGGSSDSDNRLKISNPYPNPSTGMVGIDISGITGPFSITVFDLRGRQIYHENIADPINGLNPWQLDFANSRNLVSSGVYFLRIKSPKHTTVKKCIILKN